MSTTHPHGPDPKPSVVQRLRAFWARLTEGFQLEQLWGQFKSEAQAGYVLYSKDVDWEAIGREKSKFKRILLSGWALFQAILMKLSPARRVLLVFALLLLVFHPDVRWGNNEVNFDFVGVAALILFMLLALELADRVTMKRDLEIAREIQQWLVPSEPPQIPGMDIAFATRPQNTVAGDYYDAFLRPVPEAGALTPSLLAVVADVAGKSVPAALLMATFQSGLRALSATPATLDEIVAGLERYARAHSLEGRRFTTAFIAEIDPRTRAMRYINAGHNYPILRRATGSVERLETGGPPVGMFPDFTYVESAVQLNPGDLVVAYTDGVTEAVNPAGEEWGVEGLQEAAAESEAQCADDIVHEIFASMDEFSRGRQTDDATVVVLRVH